MIEPYYDQDGITIYHGDCREVLPQLDPVDLVLTDPPYPNRAGHFDSAVDAAREVLAAYRCDEWLVFWDEITRPVIALPLVGIHIWHRTNTNRPDNYEAIYHFARDGNKRPSRVLPYAVISKGLTGCVEATSHPTQKNIKLIRRLLTLTKADTVLDPFMGSGTTAEACKLEGRRFVGVEVEESFCEIAVQRLRQKVLQFEDAV